MRSGCVLVVEWVWCGHTTTTYHNKSTLFKVAVVWLWSGRGMVVEWAWCGLACGEELRLTGHHTKRRHTRRNKRASLLPILYSFYFALLILLSCSYLCSFIGFLCEWQNGWGNERKKFWKSYSEDRFSHERKGIDCFLVHAKGILQFRWLRKSCNYAVSWNALWWAWPGYNADLLVFERVKCWYLSG